MSEEEDFWLWLDQLEAETEHRMPPSDPWSVTWCFKCVEAGRSWAIRFPLQILLNEEDIGGLHHALMHPAHFFEIIGPVEPFVAVMHKRYDTRWDEIVNLATAGMVL